MTRYLAMLALAAMALAPLAAGAQEFRCVGKDGKKYYGSVIPPQCLGQPVEQLSKQGTVIRRIDPEGDEKQREAKAAEAAQKRKVDAARQEEARRNRALLATYTSEKDIEDARKRALADNEKALKDVEGRIAGIKKRQGDLQKEMESYNAAPAKDAKANSKAKPAPAVPAKLKEDIKNAEIDLAAQQQLLDAKQKEIDQINAKYDDDKKRYISLTKGK